MKKDKIVEAHPQVSMLSGISIKEKERMICIGGFSVEGGFYLNSPYELKKEETRNVVGDATYYTFIKSSNKMCKQEKALRKIELDRLNYEKKRQKELEKELKIIKSKKLISFKSKENKE